MEGARVLIKRRIREGFRLNQQLWPEGYDFLVIVKPHEPLELGGWESMPMNVCAMREG